MYLLHADSKEFWGINGKKPISFPVNATSATHAEVDALHQLFLDRKLTGISGGNAIMLSDRLPCRPCYQNRGIRSAVRAAKLDSLIIYYSASFDHLGNFIPPGILEILP